MRRLLATVALLGTLGMDRSSEAANGTVQLTWDSCTGPIEKPVALPTTTDLFVSVLGHDQLQQGYDVRVLYGNEVNEVPDAWRFDAAGCQGSDLVRIDHVSRGPLASVCPAFQQDLQSFQIKRVIFSPPTDLYAPTLMQVLLANAYRPGVQSVAGTRYFLARIRFDHTYSVNGPTTPGGIFCGGFEQPMCFKLIYATWLDADDQEIAFDQASPQIVSFLSPSVCPPPVPARPATWGLIKSQYRK